MDRRERNVNLRGAALVLPGLCGQQGDQGHGASLGS